VRIAVLGGGHGLASVLRALANEPAEITVIVTIADDGGSSGELRRRREGPAVGDLRRSLLALTGDQVVLARAFARPLAINRLGRHPLGNLVIRSVADAFGDLTEATEWLGEQLGIAGRVLPATAEAVSLIADAGDVLLHGESAIGAATQEIGTLRFSPERPAVPEAVIEAIAQADWIILAPGSLFTSVLAACAVPDVTLALSAARARTVWISNLEPDGRETAGMDAAAHLDALHRHGLRPDVVLYDSAAELCFDADRLAREGLEPRTRSLRSSERGVHDSTLLRAALSELLAECEPETLVAQRSRVNSSCAMRPIEQ
jgi:uncharacterized cofD-like protein